MNSANDMYDDGYNRCSCFWGKRPGSLLTEFEKHVGDFDGLRVLDAGCGEGKNAVYMAKKGANVLAVDISTAALANARYNWPNQQGVVWSNTDIRSLQLGERAFDTIIAYGLLHCLDSEAEIANFVRNAQAATKQGGYHLVCAFNSRCQDLSAHPGFTPTLADHAFFEDLYGHWEVVLSTDRDLYEIHPHNNIPHTHSMTRILARRPSE